MSDVNIKVSIVSQGAQRSIKALERDTKGLEKSFKSVNLSIKNSTSALTVFAGNVAARAFTAITNNLVNLAGGFIDATKTVEDLGTQLEVLTGSAGAANQLIDELQTFSARTPFRLEGVTESANQLLAFGFAADEVTEKLQEIGDVAAASGQPLKEVTTIYGQVAAAGKLTGERLLQLRERAIPIGEALANTLGTTEAAVSDLVTQGKVDFDTFEKAFATLSEEGGKAFGGIDKASQTLSGRISTLQDNFFLLQNDIGTKLSPALKAGATAVTNFLQKLRVDPKFQEFLDAISNGIPGAIQFAGDAFNFLIIAFQKTRQAIEILRAGFSLLLSGLATAVEATLRAVSALAEFAGIDLGLEGAIDGLKTFSETSAEVAVESIEAVGKIQKSQEELTQFVGKSTSQLVKSYNEEKAAVDAKAEATVEANNKIVESNRLSAEQQKEIAAAQKALDDELKIQEQDLATVENDANLQLIEENLGREAAIRTAARQRELEADGKSKVAELELEKTLTQAKNKELITREELAKKSEKTRQANFKSSLGTIASLQGSSNKTLFNLGKAAAISTATIDGIAAVQKALSSAPPPFNFAIAALVGVATAANVAKIASAKPPSFQSGGIVAGNSLTGDRVNANLNSGEVVLNRNQQTELLGIANGNRGNGAGGGQEIVVNTTVELDGEAVARAVSRQVADGFELGEVV